MESDSGIEKWRNKEKTQVKFIQDLQKVKVKVGKGLKDSGRQNSTCKNMQMRKNKALWRNLKKKKKILYVGGDRVLGAGGLR